jgi:hypothetical protein
MNSTFMQTVCYMGDLRIMKTLAMGKSTRKHIKSKNVLVKTLVRKTRNDLTHGCAMLLLLLLLLLCSGAFASSKKTTKDAVTPCEISVSREAQEANFVVVYKFETKSGKPVNIRKVKNDFLKDDDFTACISRWTLPSLTGEGLAEFSYKHAEGWTEITVSGKGFRKSFHFDTMHPKTGNPAGDGSVGGDH